MRSEPIHDTMVLVPPGTLVMGSADYYPEEQPVRFATVDAFCLDGYPVTNRQFAQFIGEMEYVTVAERALATSDYPGIPIDRLQPGALVFVPPRRSGAILDPHDWWQYVRGACWRRPEARRAVQAGRMDHPVTCVAHEDARSYAKWAGKRLPSEAEWEWAARGGLVGARYAWGDIFMPAGRAMANTWFGEFPLQNLKRKTGYRTTRVGAFPPNGYGLFDMIGNVWEWTDSWFQLSTQQPGPSCCSPPEDSYDADQPNIRIPRRVLKGGSFLCAENYCARYRPAARQAQMIDTASVHIGFRCAAEVPRDAR